MERTDYDLGKETEKRIKLDFAPLAPRSSQPLTPRASHSNLKNSRLVKFNWKSLIHSNKELQKFSSRK